jgi:hypothetical protein
LDIFQTLSLKGDTMNIPQLQIQTTRGVLGLQITKPTQEIEQPRAVLTQEQPAAILEMSTTNSKLSVDTTELRAEIDLKSPLRRSAENAQYGVQKLMEGIARRAGEGQQLVSIENGGNTLVEIVKQNATPPMKQMSVRFIGDRSKIKMSIQPGTLSINATPQKVVNEFQVSQPIHNYIQGKVTGVMEQHPSIQIDWKL